MLVWVRKRVDTTPEQIARWVVCDEGQGEKATAVVYFGSDVGNKKLTLRVSG